jgi:hypothetical protein
VHQRDTSVLDIEDDEFEEILTTWARQNADLFPMTSANLFKICIHKLPKLRAFGFEYARKIGFSLTFALQLFESEFPEAMAEARRYFESLESQSDEEWDAILALIDSPNKAVRSFALGYLQSRKAHFESKPQLWAFLSEHSDSSVQAALANEINEMNISNPFIQRFDKEILRHKNKSRKAKNLVKERLEQNLNIDSQTLLEIARSNNRQEAEWAIVQLTKKALAGEEITGFELD